MAASILPEGDCDYSHRNGGPAKTSIIESATLHREDDICRISFYHFRSDIYYRGERYFLSVTPVIIYSIELCDNFVLTLMRFKIGVGDTFWRKS